MSPSQSHGLAAQPASMSRPGRHGHALHLQRPPFPDADVLALWHEEYLAHLGQEYDVILAFFESFYRPTEYQTSPMLKRDEDLVDLLTRILRHVEKGGTGYAPVTMTPEEVSRVVFGLRLIAQANANGFMLAAWRRHGIEPDTQVSQSLGKYLQEIYAYCLHHEARATTLKWNLRFDYRPAPNRDSSPPNLQRVTARALACHRACGSTIGDLVRRKTALAACALWLGRELPGIYQQLNRSTSTNRHFRRTSQNDR